MRQAANALPGRQGVVQRQVLFGGFTRDQAQHELAAATVMVLLRMNLVRHSDLLPVQDTTTLPGRRGWRGWTARAPGPACPGSSGRRD